MGGFSAGGNLAASVCLQARDAGTPMPRLQLLGVPTLDVSRIIKPAMVENPLIGPGILRLAHSTYFKDESCRTDPYASPLLSDDMHGLPPAVVLTAEWDVLRPEGDAYAGRLEEAGVPVMHRVVAGPRSPLPRRRPSACPLLLDLMAGQVAARVA